MNGSSLRSRRILSAWRVALLTTAIAGIGAAALFAVPNTSGIHFGAAAQAQNLSEKVQQLPQRPVGFADIVEKVKPAVISVRVKIERQADSSDNNNNDDNPFPPGSPFEKFFRQFGKPGTPEREAADRVYETLVEGGVEVLYFRIAVFGGDGFQPGLGDFRHLYAQTAGFAGGPGQLLAEAAHGLPDILLDLADDVADGRGKLLFELVGLVVHDYEPLSVHYFHLSPDGGVLADRCS